MSDLQITLRDAWYPGEEVGEPVDAFLLIEDTGDDWLAHIKGPDDQMVSIPLAELHAALGTLTFRALCR